LVLRTAMASVLTGLAVAKLLSGAGASVGPWLHYGAALLEATAAFLLLGRRWERGAGFCFVLMLCFMVAANRGLFPECNCLGGGVHLDPSRRMWLAAGLAGLAAVLLLPQSHGARESAMTLRRGSRS